MAAADLMRRTTVFLRNPLLCNWDPGVAHSLADWLDDAAREAVEIGGNPWAEKTARALLVSFGRDPDAISAEADRLRRLGHTTEEIEQLLKDMP